jgi:hypothetical protein
MKRSPENPERFRIDENSNKILSDIYKYLEELDDENLKSVLILTKGLAEKARAEATVKQSG